MTDVSIVKCVKFNNLDKIREALKKSLDLIGGIKSKIFRGDQVLIKPNILTDKPYKTGATTNPLIVDALIDILREYGIKEIIIGEGSIVGEDTFKAYKVCGFCRLADTKKVKLIDLKKDKFILMSIPNGKIIKIIKLPKTVLNSNIIINIPVIKTHDVFPATLGLKNMKGIIQENDKKKFHLLNLSQCIVDLNKIALPHLTILDGTIGMEGLGPIHGNPVNLGLIISSFDTVAADTVAALVMGINPSSIGYINLAVEQKLGTGDISKINVVGCKIEEIKREFKRAEIEFSEFLKHDIKVIEKGACSACRHMLETFLIKLLTRDKIDYVKNCTFLLGKNARLPKNAFENNTNNIIKFGTCTKTIDIKKSYFLPGCPPHVDTIRKFIKNNIKKKAKF